MTSSLNHPVCSCGTEKDVVHGVSVCCHCDQICPDRGGCILCGTFNVALNKRVAVEYAKERQANG